MTVDAQVVERGGERQHFEGDAPAERDLLRFVYDAHAAAADAGPRLFEQAARLTGIRCGGVHGCLNTLPASAAGM